MVLPMQGEIILLEGLELTLNEHSNDESCKGEDKHYVTHTDSWYDPFNWNVSSSRENRKNTGDKNLAIPHAFRVPCLGDDVIFPENTSFQVHLDSSPIRARSISINGMKYSKDELEGLLANNLGKLMFPGNPEIHIDNVNCEDISGCLCGNDMPKVLSKICSHVKCPSLECADAITPDGHCCPMCAAYLTIEYNADFDIDKLVGFQRKFLGKPQFEHVDAFTLKTFEDFVQSVFVDHDEAKGYAAEVGRIIYEELIQDMKTTNLLKLKTVKLYKSENWKSGVPTSFAHSSNGISSGGVVAIIIIIAAIIGAGAAWYIYRRRQIPGFSFARFDLNRSKIELELGTTPHEDLYPEGDGDDESIASAAASPNSFDNPVYDKIPDILIEKEEEKIYAQVEQLIDTSDDTDNVVENPMFIPFESSSQPKGNIS